MMRTTRPLLWRNIAATLGAAALLTAALQLSAYQTRDPDSRLYAAMSADLAARDTRSWVAPEWNGHWNRRGLFYEHPPGQLIAAAAAVRLGLNGFSAVYLLNTLSFSLSLWLLYFIARRHHPGGGARDPIYPALVVLVWLLTPSFVQYLVRGNHEHPLTACTLLLLFSLGTEAGAARTGSGLKIVLGGVAVSGAVALKGAAALSLLPLAAIYLFCFERNLQALRRVGAIMLLSVVVPVAGEYWFREVTGESFFSGYVDAQLAHSLRSDLSTKAQNLIYYSLRPFWFFFPWMLMLIPAAVQWWRAPSRWRACWSGGMAVFALLTFALFVGGYSITSRRAERYLFPMYPLLALAAAHVLLRSSRAAVAVDWLRTRLVRHQRWAVPALAGCLLLGGVLRVYVSTYHHVNIRWWPGY